MSPVLAREVRSFMLSTLENPLLARGLNPQQVPDDFDLLTEGVIDSLGLVELITAVEKQFDIMIDFEELDPENLTIVGPFCRYIEEKTNNSSTHSP